MTKVQLNLLPDVKLRHVQATRRRNLIISISAIVTGAALAIFLVMLLTVYGVQKKQLSDSAKQITAANAKINQTNSLSQILTVQNQLQSLNSLHHSKHIASRIFTYLPQVTPTQVNMGSLSIDISSNTINISGTADSQKTVNTFIDTLKFTTYSVGSDTTKKAAFSAVTETGFSIGTGNVSYSISAQFDPALFSSDLLDSSGHIQVPTLNVPSLTTTRSVLDDPGNVLFNGQNANPGGH